MGNMGIGSKIKKHREEKSLTQEKLAREANISLSYLYKLEKGNNNPTFDVIKRIADVLNISLDSLR